MQRLRGYKSKAESFSPCSGCPLEENCEDRSPSVVANIGWAVFQLEKTLKEDRAWGNQSSPEERAEEIASRCSLEEDGAASASEILACVNQRLQTRSVQDVAIDQNLL